MHELGNTNALKNKSAVPRPKTVVTYNKFMGGFYLSDSFQYLFRLLEKKNSLRVVIICAKVVQVALKQNQEKYC